VLSTTNGAGILFPFSLIPFPNDIIHPPAPTLPVVSFLSSEDGGSGKSIVFCELDDDEGWGDRSGLWSLLYRWLVLVGVLGVEVDVTVKFAFDAAKH
jgi:hypothetical protein